MGDFHFKQAKTWEDMRVEHDRWVADYNFQVHYAHRHRDDNRHSPAEVLGWKSGCSCSECSLPLNFLLKEKPPCIKRAGQEFLTCLNLVVGPDSFGIR